MNEFTNTLHIVQTSRIRAGGSRNPLQAEISIMKKLGLIRHTSNGNICKIGTGLEIDWPQVQNSMQFFNSI